MALGKTIETLWKNFKEWIFLGGSLATAAATLYGLYDPVDKHFEHWITEHARVDHAQLVVDSGLHVWFTLITLGLTFALVGLASTSWTLLAVNRKKVQTGEVLSRTFLRTIDAADAISRGMFPSTGQIVKRVVSCKQVYTLYDNGDCYVAEDMVVDAGIADVHFMEKTIGGEAEADPAEFPADINLKITSQTPERDIRYLITSNQPRFKSFAIFFLPVIRMGADDHRAIRTEYYWKGLLKGLVSKGQENFELEIKTSSPPDYVEYEFWAKPGIGELRCENVGGKLASGSDSLKPVSDGKGMKGWRYRGESVPPGHVAKFNLQLGKP